MNKERMTVQTSDYPISDSRFMEMAVEDLTPSVIEYLGGFGYMVEEIRNYMDQHECIPFTDSVFLDTKRGIISPDFSMYEFDRIENITEVYSGTCFRGKGIMSDWKCELPSLSFLKKNKNFLYDFISAESRIVCVCDDARRQGYYEVECTYSLQEDDLRLLEETDFTAEQVVTFPVIRLQSSINTTADLIEKVCCQFNICPRDVGKDTKRKIINYILLADYLKIERDKVKVNVEISVLMDELLKNEELLSKLEGKLFNIMGQYLKTKKSEGIIMQAKEELLNCEKIRADIDPYEERMLTDPNRGHWDLWIDDGEEKCTAKMYGEYMARNPRVDIKNDGVIAIDFGTKSTIVVYQSSIEHSLPMGIGEGNLSKALSAKRYENPTMMEFVDLDSFLADYNASKGRPDTKWEDLPISHTAMDKFENSKSEEYYAFLYRIKQWAGQRDKQFRIKPIKGESRILPAFLDIKDGDFNPIEIYAYYIGLYINNMRKGHGIFLDYYLSFPVTYEKKIRQKIIESFEKGLKKSLPEVIQNDEDIMSRFNVNGEISEPAAYAVCALQEYEFKPEGDEEYFYGIFDFGGGTTDFDFGLWKSPTKDRYDYRIENFGAGGDEFLGGENLLEMLAFEIFKENQDVMRENNYTFTLAPKSKEFVGSDALLSDSQEAEKNMHNLMEQLRPFWEAPERNEDTSYNDKERIEKLCGKILKRVIGTPEAQYVSSVLTGYCGQFTNYGEFVAAIKNNFSVYHINVFDDFDEEVEFIDSDKGSIYIKVDLFDKDGQLHPSVELETTLEFINEYIENRIREGVRNFFSALMLSYQNDKVQKPTIVNILLAGNSCKSPVVKRVFEEEIRNEEEAIRKRFNLETQEKMFEIFPPLGTPEAFEKMKSRGIKCNRDDFEMPTGKTGVAFGLIQCRVGGSIQRVSNIDSSSEIDFQFFLGWQTKKKFKLFVDDTKITKSKGKPDYNQWYRFIEADEEIFYLYYTTLPECVNGDLMVEGNAGVKRIKCSIKDVSEDAYVYIRATSPHTIQYAVSPDYDVDKNHIGEIYEKELN